MTIPLIEKPHFRYKRFNFHKMNSADGIIIAVMYWNHVHIMCIICILCTTYYVLHNTVMITVHYSSEWFLCKFCLNIYNSEFAKMNLNAPYFHLWINVSIFRTLCGNYLCLVRINREFEWTQVQSIRSNDSN